MSTAKNILELFQTLRPGQRLTAVQVSNQGAFDVTQAMVYQALASLCQPGKPLLRARNVHGVYEYELRRDVNLKPLLNGPDIEIVTNVPTGEPPAATKTVAAREGASERPANAESVLSAGAKASITPAPAAAHSKPATEQRTPFLPLDDPNPVRAEAMRIINDLRMRRDTLDETITMIELRFGVKA